MPSVIAARLGYIMRHAELILKGVRENSGNNYSVKGYQRKAAQRNKICKVERELLYGTTTPYTLPQTTSRQRERAAKHVPFVHPFQSCGAYRGNQERG